MKVDRSVSPPAERILAAADKLFYAQGIRAVGVDTLAAEAGVSKRTLYNHYLSKDALIAAYLTARFKHLAPSDAPAREQILGNFDRLEGLDARNPEALATQLQILFEGALAAALVRGDPALARSARDAAEVLLDAAGVRRPPRPRRRSARRS